MTIAAQSVTESQHLRETRYILSPLCAALWLHPYWVS